MKKVGIIFMVLALVSICFAAGTVRTEKILKPNVIMKPDTMIGTKPDTVVKMKPDTISIDTIVKLWKDSTSTVSTLIKEETVKGKEIVKTKKVENPKLLKVIKK